MEVKKVSLGQDNYPKADLVRRSQSSTGASRGTVTSTPQQSNGLDTFQGGHYDAQANQIDALRRQAAVRPQRTSPSTRTATIEVDPGYPQARVKPGHVAPGKGPSVPPKVPSPPTPPVRTTPLEEVNLGYPQATAKSGHGHAPTLRPQSKVDPMKKFKNELALIKAVKKKHDGVMKAQMKAQAPAAEAPKVKTRPQVKKSHSKGGGRRAAGGALTAVSGAVTIKNGVQNLAKGNYVEGGLQVAQGGVSVADGVVDVNLARKGASASKASARLKVGGSVLNAGMAAYDTKQAYNAFKSGNQVEGAEKASSAVINAVSAFPPTAVIGAVGGIADWAMAASGADDAMVRALTSGKDKTFQNQLKKEMELARRLVKTPTSSLERCNREQKQAYIRGLDGLKQYRQYYANLGKTAAVENIDAHIARIKGAWSK